MRKETPRLILRPWETRDRAPFAAINADPETRQYFYPRLLTKAGSDAVVDAAIVDLADDGFGFLAVERKADGALIGGAGLSCPGPEVPGGYELELGWILGRPYWRQGYATEASLACLDFVWDELEIDTVIGYTSTINAPSRRTMERIGMTYVPAADFEDTTVPAGHVLRPHVLYRIERAGRARHA
ncbi:GNAT family N-acetyltransferase [Phreatobacter stygius]|uniref:GNAT family N-acetyltransferase n=2 Tax=Phreatobacter stygius TaxID=1940610 RepID=A0A4D7BHA0_9HYPH|nr:GNAT family N-acetyltransferase [Phreatobacter stygius]